MPYLLPTRLTGDLYEVFLRKILPELLDDVPLCIRRQMWFQQSGAPAYIYLNECATLSRAYFSKQMDRTLWASAMASELNFYLSGHVKSEMDLVGRIVDARADNPRDFDRV